MKNLRPADYSILIVDDDLDFREIIETYLVEEGYTVLASEKGEEAVEKCKVEKVDLVLLDVMMPEKDGFKVCSEIRNLDIPGFLPVIMLTALGDKESKLKAYQVGADDFLNKPVSRTELNIRLKSLLRIRDLSLEMENISNVLYSLVRILETRDPYTSGHSERVAYLAELVARKMGFPENEVRNIKKGALLHDIGKISISSDILLNENKLTIEEFAKIKEHPLIGVKICSPLYFLQDILPMIRNHHEKLDGSGYPDGLQGEEILPSVRIVSVVDFYDALTTIRPYRNALSKDEALKIMTEEVDKGWWDSEVVSCLRHIS